MSGIARVLGGVPEMMRHEFQRERLARRSRHRLAGGSVRPSKVRRERPQAVLAHAFAREML
jgi:hypothetical protein